jgi:hypothetical protein
VGTQLLSKLAQNLGTTLQIFMTQILKAMCFSALGVAAASFRLEAEAGAFDASIHCQIHYPQAMLFLILLNPQL